MPAAGDGGRTATNNLGGLGAALPIAAWRKLTVLGTHRRYRRGYVLMDQTDTGRHVFVLLTGRVKVSRYDEDGYQLVLAVRGAGEVLGELGLYGRDRRSAEVRAATVCEVRVIQGDDFKGFVDAEKLNPLITQHISRRLVEEERLRQITRKHPVDLRVARGLLHFAKLSLGVDPEATIAAHRRPVEIWLSHEDLAKALDMARPTVTAKLTLLRKADIVATERGRVIILDMAALTARCEFPST